jgi:ferric-dicitrate binding protein FerR (iron transport regulator)
VAVQGRSTVTLQDGRLAYAPSGAASAPVTYNTMSTPRGRQYQLVLPDGTKVWLNAASSITYPTAFSGSDRRVTLTGEAYFEVRQDASRPFNVSVKNREEIEVLGTSFNVNGYEDEHEVKTTLLDGSVRVVVTDSLVGVNTNKGKLSVVLKPGEQAQLVLRDSSGRDKVSKPMKILSDVDVDQVVAWKNGLFQFKGATMQTVMNQLSRWYNVEVTYEGTIPEHRFVGKVSRDYNLSDVLAVLQASDIHFSIEGKRIIVRP